ncbi:MAG: hypothetical protein AB1700_20810, partial [Bacillota bacterium]
MVAHGGLTLGGGLVHVDPDHIAEGDSVLDEARVERGEIKRDTMGTYLRDANRLFESLIWLLDERSLSRIADVRGFIGDYG